MSKDTGGPAFPAESVATGDGGRRPQLYSGMTVRDYFAAKAMQGLLAHPDCLPVGNVDLAERQATDCIALEAYAVANAMLKERAK